MFNFNLTSVAIAAGIMIAVAFGIHWLRADAVSDATAVARIENAARNAAIETAGAKDADALKAELGERSRRLSEALNKIIDLQQKQKALTSCSIDPETLHALNALH